MPFPLLCLVAGILSFNGTVSLAAILTVNPAGGAMYTTVASAVAAAASGDTIQCAAGTYPVLGNSTVTINKSLTLQGAQAGNDARPRGASPNPAVETVIPDLVSGPGKWTLASSGVTIDGFYFNNVPPRTIEGSSMNLDNVAIRNCVLLAATGAGNGTAGNIQFAAGSGKTLHQDRKSTRLNSSHT